MKRKWIQSLPNSTNATWNNIMLYWLKLILNSDQDLALSWQKLILTDLPVTKLYKNRTMKISLFNYSMLGYIAPITTSLLHIYRRNSCPAHIFKSKYQIDFKRHPTQEYFRQIYHYLGRFCRFLLPGLISSTIFCKKVVFPSVNHKTYIKLHWAQFPMIGNTSNWNF